MKLLSEDLVTLDYRDQLRKDLANATVLRFLVAYVSLEGIESIGRHLLTRLLRDPRSFGVSSLSCSCGYDPLLRLQGELDPSMEGRLKYFMDPIVPDPDPSEPKTIALFHSKLVYLAQERLGKSIVYIGSHNWTRRALGARGPRNVEASLRIEEEFAPEHLLGTGGSIYAEVNSHLLKAYNLPACLDATPRNEAVFRQWYEQGCRRSQSDPLEETTVVLAVRKPGGPPVSGQQWQDWTAGGIYLQVLEESEGDIFWRYTPHGTE